MLPCSHVRSHKIAFFSAEVLYLEADAPESVVFFDADRSRRPLYLGARY